MQKSKTMLDNGFQTSTGPTAEFSAFARIFKAELRRELDGFATVTAFSKGHFYVSGFLRDSQGRCWYFTISDVRFYPRQEILIRSATDERDLTGGVNQYCRYDDLRTFAQENF